MQIIRDKKQQNGEDSIGLFENKKIKDNPKSIVESVKLIGSK